ncbi:MAG: shikimate kinase [Deltaproteobacteria bacterium]|nr:shikimate kinase [Deltaproteobacteria bacterium]
MRIWGHINNIVLIGMPGSGKSTVGVILAKFCGRGFIDTDILIQQAEGRTLQEIVDADGYLELRRIEERVLLALDCDGCVIATGGSAVYSLRAMARLKGKGAVVFLQVELAELQRRVKNFTGRGIAGPPGHDFSSLFRERLPLYQEYADIIIPAGESTPEELCEQICRELAGWRKDR